VLGLLKFGAKHNKCQAVAVQVHVYVYRALEPILSVRQNVWHCAQWITTPCSRMGNGSANPHILIVGNIYKLVIIFTPRIPVPMGWSPNWSRCREGQKYIWPCRESNSNSYVEQFTA